MLMLWYEIIQTWLINQNPSIVTSPDKGHVTTN